MRKIIPIACLFMLSAAPVLSQGEVRENPRIFYRNEKSLAVQLNSNGFGANGKYAIRLNARNKKLWEVDLMTIKHPKEVKISNSYYNNRSFVFGKKNSFFNLRGGYGRQVEMFRKVDRGGISIRRFHTFGPAIGILKPIYYEVFRTGGGGITDYYLETEKFNTSTHQGNIYGKASFFKGLKEISIVPGAFGKFGVMFEYSKNDITLHALETGIVMDVFVKKIPIMATDKNNFFFFGMFVAYRFGRIEDARGIIDEEDLIY